MIISPLVTEKITQQTELLNCYAFVVDKASNKIDIKKHVEKLYNVKVKSIRTMTYYGKSKSRNTKGGVIKGKRNAFKKAIVKLAEGNSIDIYSNV